MVGDVLAGRYELQELVGSGGMSSVYRAHDRVLERTVALKVLHQRFSDEDQHVERFRREARMVAGLSHHNIVTVIDRGEHDGREFIVFEYIPGENLKELIQRSGPLPVEHALELAIQVARGLSFAHAAGLVHRDVKPQNVLLNGNGEAKVTDFGIARSLDVNHIGMTQTGTVLGSSNYIAPEQAQGRPVDDKTDVYSLGAVLFELLAGEPPFSGDNFVAVAMRHINEPPPHVSELRADVPPRLDAAVATALAKDAGDRFASMADFGRELEACLHELRAGDPGSQTVVLPPLPRARRPRPARPRPPGTPRRLPLTPLLIAAGLVVLVAAVAVALLQDRGGAGNGGGDGGAAAGKAVAVQGVSGWDPFGTGGEHDADAPAATDGAESTYWETEHYRSPLAALDKAGVGLLLDAGSIVRLGSLTVTTDTPGFVATIQAGDSSEGPFHEVAGEQTVGGKTTFDLHGANARYFVVWITQLPTSLQAHVNEVTATG